jgi:hypothetical protein
MKDWWNSILYAHAYAQTYSLATYYLDISHDSDFIFFLFLYIPWRCYIVLKTNVTETLRQVIIHGHIISPTSHTYHLIRTLKISPSYTYCQLFGLSLNLKSYCSYYYQEFPCLSKHFEFSNNIRKISRLI